jgi:hypothetical protein
MVNIGDTVLVTVRTWEPAAQWFYNNTALLQNRLQIAGFAVDAMDDSGMSLAGASYGDLLVTVRPLASAYANANDIASVVAGAAEAVGYGSVQSYSGQVMGYANSPDVIAYGNAVNPWTGAPYSRPTSSSYSQNLQRPSATRPPPPGSDNEWWKQQLGNLNSGSTLTIAAVAFVGFLLLSRKR